MRWTALGRRLHGHVQLNQRMAAMSDPVLFPTLCFAAAPLLALPRPSASARWAAWAST